MQSGCRVYVPFLHALCYSEEASRPVEPNDSSLWLYAQYLGILWPSFFFLAKKNRSQDSSEFTQAILPLTSSATAFVMLFNCFCIIDISLDTTPDNQTQINDRSLKSARHRALAPNFPYRSSYLRFKVATSPVPELPSLARMPLLPAASPSKSHQLSARTVGGK